MKRKLNDIDWQQLFQGKNAKSSWETILKLLNDIVLKYTSRFIFSNKCKKSNWMSSQGFGRIQLKHRVYHQHLRTKDHDDYNIYVKYRNQAKRTCRNGLSDYGHSVSKEIKRNPKRFFWVCKK